MTLLLYFLFLFLTIFVEFLLYWVVLRRHPRTLFFFSLLINAVTFPLANYVYQFMVNHFLLIELGVVLGESMLIWLLLEQRYPRSLFLSCVANLPTALMSFLFAIPHL